jgi:dihydroorotate dehydrogenase electron transfer subunit
LLIAGGVGLPPIRWLAEILRENGQECKCIFGAQTRELLPLKLRGEPDKSGEFGPFAEEFAAINAPIAITTDDGSCGMRGRVTDCLTRHLARIDTSRARVFACGPEPMLRAVADICTQQRISCSLAMERMMGCGMGTCQSCVIPVRDPAASDQWRYALCCTEGPVFDAERVMWRPPAR